MEQPSSTSAAASGSSHRRGKTGCRLSSGPPREGFLHLATQVAKTDGYRYKLQAGSVLRFLKTRQKKAEWQSKINAAAREKFESVKRSQQLSQRDDFHPSTQKKSVNSQESTPSAVATSPSTRDSRERERNRRKDSDRSSGRRHETSIFSAAAAAAEALSLQEAVEQKGRQRGHADRGSKTVAGGNGDRREDKGGRTRHPQQPSSLSSSYSHAPQGRKPSASSYNDRRDIPAPTSPQNAHTPHPPPQQQQQQRHQSSLSTHKQSEAHGTPPQPSSDGTTASTSMSVTSHRSQPPPLGPSPLESQDISVSLSSSASATTTTSTAGHRDVPRERDKEKDERAPTVSTRSSSDSHSGSVSAASVPVPSPPRAPTATARTAQNRTHALSRAPAAPPPTLHRSEAAASIAMGKSSSNSGVWPTTEEGTKIRDLPDTGRADVIIKWVDPQAHVVELAGSFTGRPWEERLSLWRCPASGIFWVSLLEAVPELKTGVHFYKFVVDGEWRCDDSMPQQRDPGDNWNNVLIVSPAVRRTRSRPLTINNDGGASFASSPAAASAATHSDFPGSPAADFHHRKDLAGCPQHNHSPKSPHVHTGGHYPHQHHPPSQHHHPQQYHSSAGGGGLHPHSAGGGGGPCNFYAHESMGSFNEGDSVTSHEHDADRAANGDLLMKHSQSATHVALAASREEGLRRVTSLSVQGWPPSVLEFLISPDLLVDLQLPIDVRENSGLKLMSGGFMIPHPDKAHTGGADAYFASPETGCLGIADGVGEWDSFGLNPRLFAEQLMRGCKEASAKISDEHESPVHRAVKVLTAGYATTSAFGSSTALICCLDQPGERLGVSNLGDSTLMVLRRQKSHVMTCVMRTKEQQHTFNCPFQLARLPRDEHYPQLIKEGKATLVRVLRQSSMMPQDTPSMAATYSTSLQEGDLVLLGTDGVFDNLFDHEICALANLTMSPYEASLLQNSELVTPAEHVAAAVAHAAFHRSRDPKAKTPFARHARQSGTHYAGGKMDDITVLAAWVVRPSHSERMRKQSSVHQDIGKV
uniref:PPM-type phosphatase domain-containing protein n=1 Tax=Chromera velia CCMP2878 TaxID=1169474 RepID=A0A0G4I6Q1_9ALVE|eukprot:Cvel_11390.t1-p1 / transcript=Cvel_11390.t1 / gene=Cvel_11390 / organism=Chromera_velia_CCMP2878 / gene_product=Probable protein phosphatase 2C 80, putative / transcript_product=Probable protein phosphatase 2C 80, putative / location=Cvel_scaffold714:31982-36239(+) / protein_length=1035 / sequence_SO=supercontig / SO=protein_coding / is_pseudo=false